MPKGVKGPYFFFMLEYKQKQEAAGKVFPGGMQEVQAKASPIWNKMNADQRFPYQKMAKDEKSGLKPSFQKFTSQGLTFQEADAYHRQKKERVERATQMLASVVEDAVVKQSLETCDFYLISFAYFCMTMKGVYIPAEMAVLQYNLKDGIKDTLHMHINPSKLPLGTAYEAQKKSNEEHQLPVPPDAMGETEEDVIITKLMSFLVNNTNKIPPVFTDAQDVKIVENILQGIFERNDMDDDMISVGTTAELFFQSKKCAESYGSTLEKPQFPSIHIAESLLQKDPYEYNTGISCEYHETTQNTRFCPLSRCHRWAYTILSNCLADLPITMVPGKHQPVENTYDGIMHIPAVLPVMKSETSSFVTTGQKSFISSSNLTHITKPNVDNMPYNELQTEHFRYYDWGKKTYEPRDSDAQAKQELPNTKNFSNAQPIKSESQAASTAFPKLSFNTQTKQQTAASVEGSTQTLSSRLSGQYSGGGRGKLFQCAGKPNKTERNDFDTDYPALGAPSSKRGNRRR